VYIKSINTYFIENPKCGSSTVDYVLKSMFPIEDMAVGGFVPIEYAMRRIPEDAKIFGVVRHPLDRLVSSVRMGCRNAEQADEQLKSVIKGMDLTHGRILYHVYGPQTRYVSNSSRIQLFPFERLTDLIKLTGWGEKSPHQNKALVNLSPEDVKGRPLFATALATYKDDFSLYQNSLTNSGNV
tara:strand:- start:553 stop:1101 length:549 start_codon:yes stop_codon:yes gene_type:complete